MADSARDVVTDMEVVEDLTARSRCDEGFLQLKRLVCRNRHSDGSSSAEYRVDVVDRPLPCRPCNRAGKVRCPEGHHRCMRDTTPEQVLGALEGLGADARVAQGPLTDSSARNHCSAMRP
jgi:hypothetical protein